MTPDAPTPGVGDHERPAADRADHSGSCRIDPTPKRTRSRSDSSSVRSASVGISGPPAPVDVVSRGPSASAGSPRRGTSARSGRRRGSRTPTPRRSRARPGRRSRRDGPPLAAEANSSTSGDRSAGSRAELNASPPSRGRPWCGRARTGRARTARSGRSAGPWRSARPSASPPAGIALKPHVPQPVVIRKPSAPVSPMIGE